MHLAVHYVGSDHSLTLIVEESPDDFVGRCTLTHYSDDRGWRVFTDDAGTVLRMRYDLVSPGIDCTPVGEHLGLGAQALARETIDGTRHQPGVDHTGHRIVEPPHHQ